MGPLEKDDTNEPIEIQDDSDDNDYFSPNNSYGGYKGHFPSEVYQDQDSDRDSVDLRLKDPSHPRKSSVTQCACSS